MPKRSRDSDRDGNAEAPVAPVAQVAPVSPLEAEPAAKRGKTQNTSEDFKKNLLEYAVKYNLLLMNGAGADASAGADAGASAGADAGASAGADAGAGAGADVGAGASAITHIGGDGVLPHWTATEEEISTLNSLIEDMKDKSSASAEAMHFNNELQEIQTNLERGRYPQDAKDLNLVGLLRDVSNQDEKNQAGFVVAFVMKKLKDKAEGETTDYKKTLLVMAMALGLVLTAMYDYGNWSMAIANQCGIFGKLLGTCEQATIRNWAQARLGNLTSIGVVVVAAVAKAQAIYTKLSGLVRAGGSVINWVSSYRTVLQNASYSSGTGGGISKTRKHKNRRRTKMAQTKKRKLKRMYSRRRRRRHNRTRKLRFKPKRYLTLKKRKKNRR